MSDQEEEKMTERIFNWVELDFYDFLFFLLLPPNYENGRGLRIRARAKRAPVRSLISASFGAKNFPSRSKTKARSSRFWKSKKDKTTCDEPKNLLSTSSFLARWHALISHFLMFAWLQMFRSWDEMVTLSCVLLWFVRSLPRKQEADDEWPSIFYHLTFRWSGCDQGKEDTSRVRAPCYLNFCDSPFSRFRRVVVFRSAAETPLS